MSNRARRKALRALQLRAIVSHGEDSSDVTDTFRTLEEWNRWQRDAFRRVWRKPLGFRDNIRPDGGLIDMQARNQRVFNPLVDTVPTHPAHLTENGHSTDPKFLWEKAEATISDALDYLENARRIGRDRYFPEYDEVYFIADYPADYYRAFKQLRTGLDAVDQYGGSGSPWFPDETSAAQWVLRLDDDLPEFEVSALLALAACWWALHELEHLPESWNRDDLDYIVGIIHDAERWLEAAYRLEQGDKKAAAVRAEKDAQLDAIREGRRRGGAVNTRSKGISLLAEKLKAEKRSVGAGRLFDIAILRARNEGGSLLVNDEYTIRVKDLQLTSVDRHGKADGEPVGLSGWRKIMTEVNKKLRHK